MQYVILAFAILSILYQMPHAYYVVNYTSLLVGDKEYKFKFRGKERDFGKIHNVIFCLILSNAILFFVMLGLHYVALIGALIEVGTNVYGVFVGYHEKYVRQGDNENAMANKKRKLFGAYFVAVLIPACTYGFSWLYAKYDVIITQ